MTANTAQLTWNQPSRNASLGAAIAVHAVLIALVVVASGRGPAPEGLDGPAAVRLVFRPPAPASLAPAARAPAGPQPRAAARPVPARPQPARMVEAVRTQPALAIAPVAQVVPVESVAADDLIEPGTANPPPWEARGGGSADGNGEGAGSGTGTAAGRGSGGDGEGDPGGGPVRITPGVTPPELVLRVEPTYPWHLRAAGRNGEVVLDCVVERDGSVRVERVLRGEPAFAEAAQEAVSEWRYRPALVGGEPRASFLVVRVSFRAR